jgi:hypothetical protein
VTIEKLRKNSPPGYARRTARVLKINYGLTLAR